MIFKKTNKLNLMCLKDMLEMIQNKMRIGITLLYGHDSCVTIFENKGNSKITELRTILQRESQNS